MNIHKAIKSINSLAEFSCQDDNIDTIQWLNGTTPIPKADIEAKIVEVQAEYDANEYQRDREKEYPSIAEQLDDLYHNGIDGWKATIKTTKDKYPKD